MKMKKGQGAFEYMMSYGWAVLVIVVLAVVLWNLGVFNPSSASTATGFSAIRPVAWSFQGSGLGGANTVYATQAKLAFANIAGIDLNIAINGTRNANSTIVKFQKPGASNCGWYTNISVQDQFGNNMTLASWTVGAGVSQMNYTTVGLPAGQQVVVAGLINGPLGTLATRDGNHTCGGPSGGVYRFTITYQSALDQFAIQHTDSGVVTGTYQ
jgi:hypothetical protein